MSRPWLEIEFAVRRTIHLRPAGRLFRSEFSGFADSIYSYVAFFDSREALQAVVQPGAALQVLSLLKWIARVVSSIRFVRLKSVSFLIRSRRPSMALDTVL